MWSLWKSKCVITYIRCQECYSGLLLQLSTQVTARGRLVASSCRVCRLFPVYYECSKRDSPTKSLQGVCPPDAADAHSPIPQTPRKSMSKVPESMLIKKSGTLYNLIVGSTLLDLVLVNHEL